MTVTLPLMHVCVLATPVRMPSHACVRVSAIPSAVPCHVCVSLTFHIVETKYSGLHGLFTHVLNQLWI